MHSHKELSSKNIIYVVVIIFVFWLTFMLFGLGGEDDIVFNTFQSIDESTEYTLEYGNNSYTGTLGDFYSCLKKYRAIRDIRVKSGKKGRAKLIISDYAFLKFLTVDSEAYRFYINFAEEGLKEQKKKSFHSPQHSKSYAVNCDLSLLNSKKTQFR